MNTAAFNFNSNAKYPTGHVVSTNNDINITQGRIQVSDDVYFEVNYQNIFNNYILTISSDDLVVAWNSNQMQFWQNQLNFATWCATTGCGVSFKDHLNNNTPMLRSLYRFHIYYQIRRILDEMQVPLPQDDSWNPKSNPYNKRAYERICQEFNVSPHTNWRVAGSNNGLGRVYFYAGGQYMPVYAGGDPDHYDPKSMSFTQATTNKILHVDFIKQDDPSKATWTSFILDHSDGFTHAGVVRLNGTIRTYVWALLGAQAQTRTSISGSTSAFDAQKQFIANVEDAIQSPVDLPSSIKRYQDVLKYAGSEVNFVFGIGLYMAPSDMLLRVGRIAGYNNKIVIATADQTVGIINNDVNTDPVPPTTETGEKGIIVPDNDVNTEKGIIVPDNQKNIELSNHEDEKTALIVGSIAAGLVFIWILT